VRSRLLIAATLTTSLITSTAFAATPTPKPSTTPIKPTVATSASPTTTSSTVPSKKATTKKPIKKKVKKTATPIPSPSPVWPPVGFTANNGIYAKIPSGKELLGLISAKAGLATDVKKCEANACGAVIIAADYTCKWWEIRSTVSVTDPADAGKKILLGNLRTTYPLLNPNTYANIILISEEPLFMPTVADPVTGQPLPPVVRTGISVGNISAICHKTLTEEKLPSNIYTPIK
jgi:hypothetical protein